MTQVIVGRPRPTSVGRRVFWHEAVRDVWTQVSSGGPLTLDHRANLRIAATHAIRLAARIIDAVYSAPAPPPVREPPDAAPLPGHSR